MASATMQYQETLMALPQHPPIPGMGAQLSQRHIAFQTDPHKVSRRPSPVPSAPVESAAPASSPALKIRRSVSSMALFGMFSKNKAQKEIKQKEMVLQAVPEPDCQQPVQRPSENRPRPEIPAEVQYASQATPEPVAAEQEAKASTKKSTIAKRTSIRKLQQTDPDWKPPPLFQAYPQAIKYGPLLAPVTSSESILRTQNDLRAFGVPGSEKRKNVDHDRPDYSGKYRRQTLAASVNSQCVSKLYLLTTSSHLLQYSAEGEHDRLPEKIMHLSAESSVFASDVISGQHLVLQISQTANDVSYERPLFGFGRHGFRTDRRTAAIFFLVMDSADEMDAWLVAIRLQIAALGGPDYKPNTTVMPTMQDNLQQLRGIPSRKVVNRQSSILFRMNAHAPISPPASVQHSSSTRSNSQFSTSSSRLEESRKSSSTSFGSGKPSELDGSIWIGLDRTLGNTSSALVQSPMRMSSITPTTLHDNPSPMPAQVRHLAMIRPADVQGHRRSVQPGTFQNSSNSVLLSRRVSDDASSLTPRGSTLKPDSSTLGSRAVSVVHATYSPPASPTSSAHSHGSSSLDSDSDGDVEFEDDSPAAQPGVSSSSSSDRPISIIGALPRSYDFSIRSRPRDRIRRSTVESAMVVAISRAEPVQIIHSPTASPMPSPFLRPDAGRASGSRSPSYLCSGLQNAVFWGPPSPGLENRVGSGEGCCDDFDGVEHENDKEEEEEVDDDDDDDEEYNNEETLPPSPGSIVFLSPLPSPQLTPRTSSLAHASGKLPPAALHLIPAPHPPPTAALPALPYALSRAAPAPSQDGAHGLAGLAQEVLVGMRGGKVRIAEMRAVGESGRSGAGGATGIGKGMDGGVGAGLTVAERRQRLRGEARARGDAMDSARSASGEFAVELEGSPVAVRFADGFGFGSANGNENEIEIDNDNDDEFALAELEGTPVSAGPQTLEREGGRETERAVREDADAAMDSEGDHGDGDGDEEDEEENTPKHPRRKSFLPRLEALGLRPLSLYSRLPGQDSPLLRIVRADSGYNEGEGAGEAEREGGAEGGIENRRSSFLMCIDRIGRD